MKLTVFNLRHSSDQVTAGTGSRSRTGPVLGRSGSSSSTRRRSARGRSSSRPSPSTAAPSPRSCCQRNTWSQVRRWPHDVTTPTSWCHKFLSLWLCVSVVCQFVPTTTTWGRGRWPASEGWSPPSRAPRRSPPSRSSAWTTWTDTAAAAPGRRSVRTLLIGSLMRSDMFGAMTVLWFSVTPCLLEEVLLGWCHRGQRSHADCVLCSGPYGERDDQQVFIQRVVPDTDKLYVRLSSNGKRWDIERGGLHVDRVTESSPM